eukprot:8377975-Pyramimonas_sp.AAC.1
MRGPGCPQVGMRKEATWPQWQPCARNWNAAQGGAPRRRALRGAVGETRVLMHPWSKGLFYFLPLTRPEVVPGMPPAG